MAYQGMRRTLYKNARFDVETTTERSRRRTEIQRKEGRERDIQLRRNLEKIEQSPSPQPVKKELTRREKLLRWKAEKEAILLAQKAKKKPPFKVGAFQGLVIKDTTLIPLPKSTVKKAAVVQPVVPKKQTAATQALAALSSDSGRRITRSQTKSQTISQEDSLQSRHKHIVMPTKVPKLRTKPDASKPTIQASFAPANHVFKPPINLTFPVTPDLMKRNKRPISKQPNKTSGLLAVPGVKPLEPSSPLKNVSKNPQSLSTVTGFVKTVFSEKQRRNTPASRRSTRLATPRAAPDSADCGGSPTKQMKIERAEFEEKGEENKENQDDDNDEDRLVVKSVSRMSIHSPTRVEVITPPELKLEGALPAQFSPFIVTGRGADRHTSRRSRGFDLGNVSCEDGEKAEQVKQFRTMLETETNHLLELCDKWESLKNSATEDLPMDIQDMILAAVGQARLLTKDKFQQFKRLIDKFELGTSEDEKMTADDLTGFWEMVQVTVNALKNQFKKLSDLQSNSWKEEVKVVRKKPTAVLAPRVNNVRPEAVKQSQARFREFVAAAKKLRHERMELSQNKSSEKTFDGGFFKVESPKREPEDVPQKKGASTPKPTRKSLLQTVLTHSANRAVKSPSVSKVSDRIRVSLVGRRTSLSRPEDDLNFVSPPPPLTAVPTKSILKSANKSVKRHTVVFNQAGEGSENDGSLSRSAPRRSLRFNLGTKVDDSAA